MRRPLRSAGKDVRSEKDPEADWTGSHHGARSHFGYKVHLGVDAVSLLVRRAALTPAKVYETEVADQLVSGGERAVYGERATSPRGDGSGSGSRESKTGLCTVPTSIKRGCPTGGSGATN